MNGKTVILCEGRHDLIFLSLLLERAGRRYLSKNWNQICDRSASSGEQRTIEDFLRLQERSSFLIKQDNNRDTCINHFWMIYEDADERYSLKMVLDSDNGHTLQRLKEEMLRATHKDLLNQYSDCVFSLKAEEESGIFLYPTTLTDSVLKVTGKNLNNCHDGDSQKRVLKEFLKTAYTVLDQEDEDSQRKVLEEFLEEDIKWVGELERFLFGYISFT